MVELREAMEERARQARKRGRVRRWLRDAFSLFSVKAGPRSDTVTMRVRWWAWPVLLLRGCGELSVRPRAAWAVLVPVVLFIGLRQSMRSLLGRA